MPKKSSKETDNERLERQRLTSLINSMADAVIAVDKQCKVVLYNGATLNILDVNNISAGISLSKLLEPIDTDNQPFDIVDFVKNTKRPTTNRDLRLKYADGSTINLYISIAPVHLGYGEQGQRGYVLLLRDITREKSIEEERDEFISVVSHELRTPIAIAEGNIGNAEFISEKTGDISEVRKALKEAHIQVLFLADMINDLSTLSRAERGKLELDIEPINVHELLNELLSGFTPEAESKGITIKTVIDPKLELLQSSQMYVREILQNLITNAIKYTRRGQVTIDAVQQSKGVRIIVKDTGIGINKADQDRVFDKFFRSEDYRTREANGSGLGLYVTIKLIKLIHAEINLDSELNKGSTFTLDVPNLKTT